MSCKTCLHWDARLDKRGRRILRGNHYRCRAPEPPLPALPASVDVGRNGLRWPPHRVATGESDGEDCPFWAALPSPPERME